MNKIVEELLREKHRAQPPRVLLVAAECSPFSKTGGLADVAGALPKSLGALGFETCVITPYHRCIKDKYACQTTHLCNFEISLGWRRKYVGLEKLEAEGLTVYLVDCDDYFGDKIYRGGYAEGEQYAFFQRAVMELIPCLDFEPEILHCNDWHTAMIPFLVKTQYRGRPQGDLKTILTIHNLAFQGKFDFGYISDLLGVDSSWYRPDCIEHYGCANFMKAGFVFADAITTVSPNYAREILTPEYGEGLQNVLASRGGDVYGIVNGLDIDSFNPATDKSIARNYDISTVFEAKRDNKIALMNELGLTCSPDTPLVAMVTRMTSQKGFDLVMQRIDELMTENVAFVLLGSGDAYYEGFMRDVESRYKGRLCAYLGYSEPLSRRIYAGADFLLMPSAFEPCGLSQLISMRYGTVPIVRETGGLKDTVMPYNCFTGEGTGFSFFDYDSGVMLGTIRYALQTYWNTEAMQGLIRAGMSVDSGFEKSSLEYAKLFMSLLHRSNYVATHDPLIEGFRSPMGAVKAGQSVTIRVRSDDELIQSVKLIAGADTFEMRKKGNFFEYTIETSVPGIVWYRFVLDNQVNLSADGIDCGTRCFQLTVYDPDFETPEWAEGAVTYQIFPDRWCREGTAPKKGAKYHESLGRTVNLRSDWNAPVKWQAENGEQDYVPNDYFGGTLKGIEKTLPELAEMGVKCLYLNPIFEADSNHRYNTADYFKVDPILGTMTDFKSLTRQAKKLGIHLVLDGVFSHTGDDSIYFNKYSRYEGFGAYHSKNSEFYPWYTFSNYPDDYHCWWNFETLPEVNEHNEKWQEFVVSGDNSVLKTWLSAGADGWRLDVADEIPDDVIELIRENAKSKKRDALIIGEVWEDATSKVSYGVSRTYAFGKGLDSVMNYPLRTELLKFAQRHVSAYDLSRFLATQKINYPAPMYSCLMNLLGSHDTPRLRTILACGVDGGGMERWQQAAHTISDEQNSYGRSLQRLLSAIQFALPGMPSVYYGDEEGMQGLSDPFCREPYKRSDGELREHYSELMNLRNSTPELLHGDVAFCAPDSDVICILRFSEQGATLLAVNRSWEAKSFKLSKNDFIGAEKAQLKSVPAIKKFKIKPMDFTFIKIF